MTSISPVMTPRFRFKNFIITVTILVIMGICARYIIHLKHSNRLQSGSILVHDLQREFYYFVPEPLSKNASLIFVLHGSSMEAKEMESMTGRQFTRLADSSKNVIIVYPQGYKKFWNDCRKSALFETKTLNVDDVGFFESMIKFFVEKHGIDAHSVFVTGYSNGAHMCFKLAKERPDLFKGFAPVCGNLPFVDNDDCYQAQQPVSMLLINGTADPINPYNGGPVNTGDGMNRGNVISTEETLHYWLSLDKCDSISGRSVYAYPDMDTTDHSTAIQYTYRCIQTHKIVELIKVINGGHVYANPVFRMWPPRLGNDNNDINMPEIVFDFFMNLK